MKMSKHLKVASIKNKMKKNHLRWFDHVVQTLAKWLVHLLGNVRPLWIYEGLK